MTSNYTYTPIDPDAGEIRLVTIQPGIGDSSICISFSTATLPIDAGPPAKPDLAPLRRTLPNGWTVGDTVDDNLLFVYNRDERSSYSHPDPNVTYQEEDWRPPPNRNKIPQFEALSYCWGQEAPLDRVLVLHGQAPPALENAPLNRSHSWPMLKEIKVRPNLADALRHLRDPSKQRTLWVDALCIDQLNLDERARHVAKMGLVYQMASRVVVWLGIASDDSAFALNTLGLIGAQMEYLSAVKVPAPDSEHPEWIQHLPLDKPQTAAMRALLNRPWFQRLWIWQEIVLGHKDAIVQCGHDTLSWYRLRRALVLLRETHLSDATARAGLLPNPLLFVQYCTYDFASAWDGMCGLIHGTALAACSDPRDRVYGFLGLCDRRLAERIRPDYTLTVSDVYVNFFLEFLDEHKDLGLLRFCTLATRDLNAPTWVPDLRNVVARPTQFTLASGNTRAEAGLIKPGVLGALGARATTVKELSSEQLNDAVPSMAQGWRAIKDWYALASRCVPEEDISVAFFETINHGFVLDLGHRNCLAASLYHDELQKLTNGGTSEPSERDLATSRLMNHFNKQARHHGFISTADGHIGVAPLGTQPGDVIAALLGCKHIMILRPNSNGEYKVIGPAYIHGLNDAQALLGPLPSPWVVKIYRPGEIWQFLNTETGIQTAMDPRLGALPEGWNMTEDGKFQSETGIVSRQDPRCEPDKLRELGARLEVFHLI